MRGAVLVVLSLTALAPRLAAQQAAGNSTPTIGRIIVRTHNLFDSTEAARSTLFRLANAVHVTTMPSVVRRELLFREGEPLDSAKVAETARNLRNRGLFRSVDIRTTPRGSGDTVDVVIETGDGWTTQLVANGWFTAGEFSWALGLVEQNLLGTGTRAGAVYRDEPDRTALQLSTRFTRLFGTRLDASGYYDDLSDGTVGAWQVGAPFRALGDRHGFGLSGEAGRERVLRFRDGDSVRTFRRRRFVQRLAVAAAPVAGTGGYVRVGLGAQLRREEYLDWETPEAGVEDSLSGTIGLFVEALDSRFKVVTHYDGFARPSDVDLSTRGSLYAWLAPSAFGYAESGVGVGATAQAGVDWGSGFARVQAEANGLLTGSGLDTARARIQVTAAERVLARHATVLHAEYGVRRGTPPPGTEFDLGHGLGPRAFGPHAFTGDRMAWGSIEHRAFLVDEVLGLLGLGFAGFVDYGGAWFADQEVSLGGDVGLGLRLGATRATSQNVGRLDVAYRFGDGFEGRRWAVSFGRGFAF
jgi:hypothetical protein